jgi:small GTP-binding protein
VVDEVIKKKVVLTGDAGVGKTSLINRFVKGHFDDKYLATIGTNVYKKEIVLRDYTVNKDIQMSMMIWDVLGQEGFDRVKRTAYTGSEGAFMVCDLTRQPTVANLRNWAKSFTEVVGDVPVIILGNKVDLITTDNPNLYQLENLARELGYTFYTTSARTGANVNESFHLLGETLYLTTAKPMPSLTLQAVLDIIMDSFCNLHGGQERAMPIVQAAFAEAGVDFLSVKPAQLKPLVEKIIEKDFTYLGRGSTKEKEVYEKLVDEFSRQEEEREKLGLKAPKGPPVNDQSVKSFSNYTQQVVQSGGNFDMYKAWVGGVHQ